MRIRWLSPLLVLALGGCVPPPVDFGVDDGAPRPVPSVTQPLQILDQDAFWAMIEDARIRGRGDPNRMADALDYKLYDANDETIRSFQAQLVAASKRLYTWRHGEAAELICGGMDSDEFSAWRSWVISLGRATFDKVVANADDVADVQDLKGGCYMWAERIGWVASEIWSERHPDNPGGLAQLDPGTDPTGVRIHGDKAIRAALPKVAART
jgi:hypothetical protein